LVGSHIPFHSLDTLCAKITGNFTLFYFYCHPLNIGLVAFWGSILGVRTVAQNNRPLTAQSTDSSHVVYYNTAFLVWPYYKNPSC